MDKGESEGIMEFKAGHLYRADGQIYRAAVTRTNMLFLYRPHEEGGAMLGYVPMGERIGFVLEPGGSLREIIQGDRESTGPGFIGTPGGTINFEYVGVADTPFDDENEKRFREIVSGIDLE